MEPSREEPGPPREEDPTFLGPQVSPPAPANPPASEPARSDWAEHWNEVPTLADSRLQASLPVPGLTPAPAAVFRGPLPEIPGYELLGELGRGGMGVVYKARQIRLNRIVALKMILAGKHASHEERERFVAEAQAAASLQHANIVHIYEVAEHEDCPYFSLEYVDGPSLGKKYSGAAQDPRLAAQLVETLARAMHYAHQHGIIHRDLKPGNVLINPEGVPKITDFGLAKQLKSDSSQTFSGMILGTPGYMAPEQAQGQSKMVGPPADVYSLGAILYELLAGRPPFQAGTPIHTLLELIQHEPTSLSRLQPSLPRDLQTICEKAMQKEPSRRYLTAEALACDLDRFLTDRPIEARRVSRVERLWRWRKRNPGLAALSSTVALLLVILTVGSLLTAGYLHQDRDKVLQSFALAKEAEMQANQARREATDKLWEASLAHAQASRHSGTVGSRFQSLGSLAEAARIRPAIELRNEAIACLALMDLRPVRQWPASAAVRVFDHRGRRYVEADPGSIRLCAMENDAEVVRLPGCGSPVTDLALSPDDRWLLVRCQSGGEAGALHLWDLVRKVDRPLSSASGPFAFSPDSRLLARVCADGTVGVEEVASGKEVQRLDRLRQPAALCFDPRRDRLAACSRNSPNVEVFALDNGLLVETYPHPTAVTALAWSPDAKLLAAGCEDLQIYVWDTATQSTLRTLEGHRGLLSRMSFNHAGSLLFSTGRDLSGRIWDPWTGRQLLLLSADVGDWYSQDDRRLAIRRPSREYVLYDVVGSPIYQALHGHERVQPGPLSASFSPDGRWLASGASDGVRIWDLTHDRQAAFLAMAGPRAPRPGRPDTAIQTLFTPSGQTLLAGGALGLSRCSFSSSSPPGDDLQLGPPERLRSGAVIDLALDGNGKTLALLRTRSPHVLLRALDRGTEQQVPVSTEVQSVALSPDGRWLALGAADHVSVWDVQARALAHLFPGCCTPAAFSPDGRWLATSSQQEYRLWHTGSWEPGPQLGRHRQGMNGLLAFSPRGSLAAVAFSNVEVDLLDTETGTFRARLEAPDPALLADLCFHPEGDSLAAATENHVIHLWDLRRIHSELAQLGLDWKQEPAPSPPPPDEKGAGG